MPLLAQLLHQLWSPDKLNRVPKRVLWRKFAEAHETAVQIQGASPSMSLFQGALRSWQTRGCGTTPTRSARRTSWTAWSGMWMACGPWALPIGDPTWAGSLETYKDKHMLVTHVYICMHYGCVWGDFAQDTCVRWGIWSAIGVSGRLDSFPQMPARKVCSSLLGRDGPDQARWR